MDFSECEGLRVSFYGFEFCRNHYTSLPRQLQVLQANGASSKELCESKQKEKKVYVLAEQKSKTWWLWDLKASRLTGFSFLCCCAGFESRNLVFSKGWI